MSKSLTFSAFNSIAPSTLSVAFNVAIISFADKALPAGVLIESFPSTFGASLSLTTRVIVIVASLPLESFTVYLTSYVPATAISKSDSIFLALIAISPSTSSIAEINLARFGAAPN